MKEIEEKSKTMKVLDSIYEKANTGLPKLKSTRELASSYMSKRKTLEESADYFIRIQVLKCGTSGFLTGIGGLPTMAIAIPANLVSVLYIQIRMIATIAIMAGLNENDDRTKTMVYLCLAGQSVENVLKNVGIKVGTKYTWKTLDKLLTREVLKKINQSVGHRFLTKLGTKGTVNLWKVMPIVGGIVGGSFDTISTRIIGKTAKKMFLATDENFELESEAIQIEIQKLIVYNNLIKIDGEIHEDEKNLFDSFLKNNFATKSI